MCFKKFNKLHLNRSKINTKSILDFKKKLFKNIIKILTYLYFPVF